ncbi:MAG: hypothetical protein CTY38_03050 [Methylotenera sp.]|uniref:hypothetical protein n=1 Tax=Methylotenera sp. TaxID=2051956 RepID=UPI000D478F73|nr:hypothetical protein [Methylotenera sp.]PPC83992.1 MAG: hypothetical protein CTY38_03050 [Methylotenera sp.]
MSHFALLKQCVNALPFWTRRAKEPSKLTYKIKIAGACRDALSIQHLAKYNIPLNYLKDYVQYHHHGSFTSLPSELQKLLACSHSVGALRGLEISQFIAQQTNLAHPQNLLLLLIVNQTEVTIYATVHTNT